MSIKGICLYCFNLFYIPKSFTVTNICLDALAFQLIVEHILSLQIFPSTPPLKKKEKTKKQKEM